MGFDVSLVATEWFLCLFSKSLPSEVLKNTNPFVELSVSFKVTFLMYTDNFGFGLQTTLRVWDVLFFEGAKVLFHAALAIFKVRTCLPLIILFPDFYYSPQDESHLMDLTSFADERKRTAYDPPDWRCNQHITDNFTPAL